MNAVDFLTSHRILINQHARGVPLPHLSDERVPTFAAHSRAEMHATVPLRGRSRKQRTSSGVEFERKLDKIAAWFATLSHRHKCLLLENILRHSASQQVQLLHTVLQPSLHRDFMYTVRSQFPEVEFSPVSTYVTRELKERLIQLKLVNTFHRMASAYVQKDEDVEAVKFPSIVSQSQACAASTEPTASQSDHFAKHSLSEKLFHSEWSRQGYGSLFHKHNKIDTEKFETNGSPTSVSLPEEAAKVVTLYAQRWNERKRNKFLLKIVLSLDPRQIYFLSKFLSVKQEKDIVGLLPENLALKILAGLRPRDLLAACMVSKQWERLAGNNSLWRLKCQDVNVVVPVPPDPDWKIVFRDNYMLRLNWRKGRCETAEFAGHSDSVQCVTCDSERIASGSADKTIRVWDIKTKELLHVLKGHTKGVWCLQFFTRHLLVSGSFDNTIRIWNLRTGLTTRTLFGHEGQIWCLKIRGPLLVSGSQDKTAKLWDIGRCLLLGTLSGHSAAVFNVDTSEDNKMVLTASGDKTVRLWSADTFQLVKCVWVSPSTSVMTVSYCQGYFACSYDGTVCLYKGTKLVRTFNEHRKRVESLKLKITDPDKGEGHITSAGQDGLIKYWDVTQDDSLQTYKGHQQPINCIFVDDLRIATASTDHSVKLLNFNVGVSSRRETKRK